MKTITSLSVSQSHTKENLSSVCKLKSLFHYGTKTIRDNNDKFISVSKRYVISAKVCEPLANAIVDDIP